MKRALFAALVVVASCIAVAGPVGADPAPVICPSNDVVDPAITAYSMTPSHATIGRANKTVTMTVRATDNCAISRVTAYLVNTGTPNGYPIYFTKFHLASGTTANGTWSQTLTIQDQQPGGTYKIWGLQVVDANYNEALRNQLATPTITLRHETKTLLRHPATKVSKKVTINGTLTVYNGFGTWTVQVQKHAPGKHWSKVRNVTTNAWGDYKTSVTIKGTTYFRVVHFQDGTTVGSTSTTYKVKKK